MLYEIIAHLIKGQNAEHRLKNLRQKAVAYQRKMKALSHDNAKLTMENRILKKANCPFAKRKRDLNWIEFNILSAQSSDEEDAVLIEEFMV